MAKRPKKVERSSNELVESILKKVEKHEKAASGDVDALIECSFLQGVITREQLDDWYRIKKEYGGVDE